MTTFRADTATNASANALKRDVDFLVVGTPRSGTTLVQRLACELPGVGMPRETEFWLRYRSSLLRSAPFPIEGTDLLEQLDRIVNTRPLARQEIDVEALMIGMGARCASPVEMFSGLVRFLAGVPHVAGEKTPSHLWWWQPLARAMPKVKIIGVVRDPRAVAASMRRMPWGPHRAALVSEAWALDQQCLTQASCSLPDRVLVLRYEDVVSAPGHAKERIARFLGLEARGEDQGRAVDPLFDDGQWWMRRAFQAVTNDRVDAWRSELDVRQVRRIESICWREMNSYGYQLDNLNVVMGLSIGRISPADQYRRIKFRMHRDRRLRLISRIEIPSEVRQHVSADSNHP
jgi:sulfotransferase family protein